MSTQAIEHPIEGPSPRERQLPGDIAWKDAPRIIGSGVAMGSADVVPGVSGGTMAVACGIYLELLAAIASVNVRALRALSRFQLREVLSIVHWRFLLSLLLGIGVAFVVMLRIVGLPRLLQERPTEVYAVFFGLVLASVGILGRRITGWSAGRVGWLGIGTVIGFAIVSLVPVSTPDHPLFLFASGVIAISAMILPGISGSFVLLILGKYEYIISSVERLMHFEWSALGVVVPFALGCVLGLAAFTRFLSWLLRRFEQPMLALLTGLLVGSLWRIWPFQEVVHQEVRGKLQVVSATPFWPSTFDVGVIALIIAGVAAVIVVELIAARHRARTHVGGH